MIGRFKNEKIAYVFDIFEMGSECSSWSLLYHVDLGPMRDQYPKVRRHPIWVSGPPRHEIRQSTRREHLAFSPVHFIRVGEEGDELLLLRILGKIISYHLEDNTFIEV